MKKMTQSQTDAMNRKTVGVLIMAIGILLMFGIGVLVRFADLSVIRQKFKRAHDVEKTQQITVNGTPACLPKKLNVNSDQTEGCLLGIKTQEGDYYALSTDNPLNLYGEIGSKEFEIKGELIKAGTEEKYDIIGTIISQ